MHVLLWLLGGWFLIAMHRVARARRRERTRIALVHLLKTIAERNKPAH
jgi:hypothetical protein